MRSTTWNVAVSLAAVLTLSSACNKTDPSAAQPGVAQAADGVSPRGGGKPGSAGAVPQAPPRGPERPVFSLLDNRLSAHVLRQGGLVVLPGSAGFAKYLRFGKSSPSWIGRGQADGIKVGTIKTKVGSINVPLTAEQADGASTIRVRARSAAPQRLGVRVNKDKEITVELGAGWSTVELPVPTGALEAGENEIVFLAGSSGLQMAWIQVGGSSAADEAPDFYDPGRKSLALPAGGGLAWYVTVPEKGLLVGDLDDGACRVAVKATAGPGALVTGALVGRGSAVSLAPLGGKVARLELTASGCPVARLARAALVVPGAARAVTRGAAPKHVVLWIMDSLRADRVRAIVGESARPETPVLDRMLSTSTFFTQAYVQGNETKSSHASIWTSLYPSNHQMIPPNERLDHKWVTLDEVAKAAGMLTSGVSANGYITPKRGFGSAWDRYRNHIHEGGGLRAEDVLRKGIESIKDPASSWFLYLGSIDTHVSWRAKEPWFSRYDPEPYSGRFRVEASGVDMDKLASGRIKVTDRDKTRIIALYDSNVSYQDQQVGVLLAQLTAWGVADETMVIITADHGDEQFEHGRVGHGASVWETLVYVPLIVQYPPLFPAGKVSEGVETVDILPTIADALGVKPDPAWQGESFIPLANGIGRGYPRLTMASKYELAHAGRMGRWKVYYAGGGRPELFDLATDPEEKANRASEQPVAVRMVADALWLLRTYNRVWKKSRWGNPANVTEFFAADMGE
jgi:arylsulfatase